LKNILKLICVWTTLLSCPLELFATHIVGGEITYRFVERLPNSKIRYKFRLTVYRDCRSGVTTQLDSVAAIGVFLKKPTGSYVNYGDDSSRILLRIPKGSARNVAQPSYPCLTPPPDVCAEEGIYEWESVIRQSDQSYFVTYQRCCRNSTIGNINNPGSAGSTYTVEITPESQASENSSPYFRGLPPTIICGGEPFNYEHSASDNEGDQLVYSFCSPLTSPSGGGGGGGGGTGAVAPPYNTLNFRSPYSASSPLGSTLRIDPNTGMITGTASMLEIQLVVSICVEEYRNGVWIGRIFRDFQFNIRNCTRNLVANIVADSIFAPDKKFIIHACDTFTWRFDNISQGRANVSNIYWEFDMKGNKERFTDWSPSITFRDTGYYQGKLYLNPGTICGDTANIEISIGSGMHSDFSIQYDTCNAGPVLFESKATTSYNAIQQLIWNFGDGTQDATYRLKPIHQYSTAGRKLVNLLLKDKNGCVNDTTIVLDWLPAPPILLIEPDVFVGCAPAKVFFNNRSTPLDTTYKIVWDFGDGTKGNKISPTHLYDKEGIYTVKLQVTSPLNCHKEAEFTNWIKVRPLPYADFDWQESEITNLAPSVHFQNQSSDDVISHRWYFGGRGLTAEQNPIYSYRQQDTGFHQIRLFVTNQYGCKDSVSKQLYIKPTITLHFPNAFTPNNDARNDEFKGLGFLYGLKDYRFVVWNRWGEKQFESTDPLDGWNGSKNNAGLPAPEGVYLYELVYITPTGQLIQKKEYFTLYR
jgi:gliding motility-associated-like protein